MFAAKRPRSQRDSVTFVYRFVYRSQPIRGDLGMPLET